MFLIRGKYFLLMCRFTQSGPKPLKRPLSGLLISITQIYQIHPVQNTTQNWQPRIPNLNNLLLQQLLSLYYDCLQVQNLILMDLGSCFAVFVVIALVLLFLFLLLLKWFDYLQKKKKNREGVDFQTLEETVQSAEGQSYQGAYQQYCERKSQKNRQLNQSLLDKDEKIEFSLKRELTKISNDLYGLSSLREKLNRQVNEFDSFTNSPMIPLKDLSFDRIKTMQTKEDSKSERMGFEFIKKLVCYSREGISIIEIEVQSLTKKLEKIILKKKVQQNFIQNDDQPTFQNCLQALGFEKYMYNCFKIICNVDAGAFKNDSAYSLKTLDVKQSKLDIDLEQYQTLLEKVRNDETAWLGHRQ